MIQRTLTVIPIRHVQTYSAKLSNQLQSVLQLHHTSQFSPAAAVCNLPVYILSTANNE